MSYREDSPDPAERLMASWGKWFIRVGLVVVIVAAVLGAIHQQWSMFSVGVFGIVAFVFNRYMARKQARK